VLKEPQGLFGIDRCYRMIVGSKHLLEDEKEWERLRYESGQS